MDRQNFECLRFRFLGGRSDWLERELDWEGTRPPPALSVCFISGTGRSSRGRVARANPPNLDRAAERCKHPGGSAPSFTVPGLYQLSVNFALPLPSDLSEVENLRINLSS